MDNSYNTKEGANRYLQNRIIEQAGKEHSIVWPPEPQPSKEKLKQAEEALTEQTT